MYEQYWGLSPFPFDNRVSGPAFYESPTHEEALARLFYCIEQDKALAVLHGPAGCGKSQVLSVLSEQIRRTQRFLAAGNLANLAEREFLRLLEVQLRLGGTDADGLTVRRRRLEDFFESTADSGLKTVLLLDGLERVEDSAVFALRRLVDRHNQRLADVTIILSLNPGRLSRSVKELLELAEMGVELPPLSQGQTEAYVQKRLGTAGSERTVFGADAMDELQQRTAGVPREINRLCDLALLAGMDENQTAIGRRLIANVAGEHKLP
jgi:general secretion pathway protein A